MRDKRDVTKKIFEIEKLIDKERENSKYQIKMTKINGMFMSISFAVMKLMGIVDWSWKVVCLPTLLSLVIIIVIAIVSSIFIIPRIKRYI